MTVSRTFLAVSGAALFTLAPFAAAPAFAQMTQFERGFYETCLPDCVQNEDLAKRVILHGASVDPAFNVEKASDRIKQACVSFCGCGIGVLQEGFRSPAEQAMATMQPGRIVEWMKSDRGSALLNECKQQRLVLPFEAVRPVASYCTEEQKLEPGNDGPRLSDTPGFRYILDNYEFDLRPRPKDAYARDNIAMKAAGFSYARVLGAANRTLGISGGTGVEVNSSTIDGMPQFSIVLRIDNQPITGGVGQVHKIFENKGLGDEMVLCGIRHKTENNRSVWKEEFIVRARVAEPKVAKK